MTSAGDLSENDDFNFLGENWHFEDDFESYEQFVFEDARSAVSPIFFWLLRIQGYLTSLLNVDYVY